MEDLLPWCLRAFYYINRNDKNTVINFIVIICDCNIVICIIEKICKQILIIKIF